MSSPRKRRFTAASGSTAAATDSRNHPEDLRIRRALLRWFDQRRRDLPWRQDRDPYRVWLSEIMLQQTQVATVIPFYRRFMAAFPNVGHLSNASLEQVLKLWSGLGYYRRARHLHAAAGMIVREFDGQFPRDLDRARKLPGVGRYTAGAVLSIAYNLPLVALDGNVARVVARLDARKGNIADTVLRRAIERRLNRVLARRRPGDFNQALMELGQTVCLPRSPRCAECPIGRWCRAHQLGRPEGFPSPRPRRTPEQHHLAAALVARNGNLTGRVLMVRGLDDGLMEDLWNFPSAFGASRAEALRRLHSKLDDFAPGARLGPEMARVRHNITYRNIDVTLYRAEAVVKARNDLRWLGVSQFDRAAVSELARKIARATGRSLTQAADGSELPLQDSGASRGPLGT